MPNTLYPLGHEIAKVQAEIVAFRNEYLPVFLEISRTPELIPPVVFECQQNTFHLLSSWQDAITKVGDALPLPGRRYHDARSGRIQGFHVLRGHSCLFSVEQRHPVEDRGVSVT